MTKAAIVVTGPSGVGKGTQAFRLTKYFPDFVHLDTGQEIKKRVDDPAFVLDPHVVKQREVYYRGDLNDTQWATALVCERIAAYAKEGHGVVLSGSPRTVYEAEQVGRLLRQVFGQRALIIKINVPEDVIRQRMANRVVCDNALCGFPATKELTALLCPQCGKGKFAPKIIDSREGMRKRIRWFYTETLPAISHLCLLGIPLVDIDGEAEEEVVFSRVLAAIKGLGLVRKKTARRATPVPKIGQDIYVRADDFIGGLAKVKSVEKSKFSDVIWVEVEERPGWQYNWQHLAKEQNERIIRRRK